MLLIVQSGNRHRVIFPKPYNAVNLPAFYGYETCCIRTYTVQIFGTFGKYSYLRSLKYMICHYSLARPQVAGEGNGLHIRRLTTNVFHKQSRSSDKGWSSSLWIGLTSNNTSPWKNSLLHVTQGLGTGRIFWNGLGTGKYIRGLEHWTLLVSLGQVHWKKKRANWKIVT